VLSYGKDTGIKILPQSVRYVEDESLEWAELDYKLKVHKFSSVSVNLTYPLHDFALAKFYQVSSPPKTFKEFLLQWNCGIFSLHSLSKQVCRWLGLFLMISSWHRIENRGKDCSLNTGNGKDAKEEGNVSKNVNNILTSCQDSVLW
jgi:hypothetical protein